MNKIDVSYILLGDLVELDSFINDLCIDGVMYVINCVVVVLFGNNLLIWKVNVDGILVFGKRML